MNKISYITFLKAFLAENSLPPIYDKIAYHDTLLSNKKDTKPNLKNNLICIQDIPNYLNLDVSQDLKSIKVNSVKTLKGHLIELSIFRDFNDYVAKKFSSKSKSNLNRYKRRLESCFNINYVAYYGAIEKEEYNRIFVVLKRLLVRRFHQKKEKNYELQYLDEFHELCYGLIMQKKANLYIIYSDNEPISIRINMLKDNLAYYIISGYDIDYGKFHLGSIDMLSNIEWCFENNYKIYDLLKGYDYYKQKWATTSYSNYTHIVYNSSSFMQSLKANYLTLKEKGKNYFFKKTKSYNLYAPYKNLKRAIYSFKNSSEINQEVKITTKLNVKINNRGQEISFKEDIAYAFLKRHIYNFLFINKEKLENIKAYSLIEKTNSFEIQGKNNNQLLIIDTLEK